MYCINITPRKTWGLLVKYGYFFQNLKRFVHQNSQKQLWEVVAPSSNKIFAILMMHNEDMDQCLSVFIVDKTRCVCETQMPPIMANSNEGQDHKDK